MERGFKGPSSHLVLRSPLNQPSMVQVTEANSGQVEPKRVFILLIKGGSWGKKINKTAKETGSAG